MSLQRQVGHVTVCIYHTESVSVTQAAVSGDSVIHTGSSVGLCVVVEDLLEIRERGIQDEGKRFGVEEEEVFRK